MTVNDGGTRFNNNNNKDNMANQKTESTFCLFLSLADLFSLSRSLAAVRPRGKRNIGSDDDGSGQGAAAAAAAVKGREEGWRAGKNRCEGEEQKEVVDFNFRRDDGDGQENKGGRKKRWTNKDQTSSGKGLLLSPLHARLLLYCCAVSIKVGWMRPFL